MILRKFVKDEEYPAYRALSSDNLIIMEIEFSTPIRQWKWENISRFVLLCGLC